MICNFFIALQLNCWLLNCFAASQKQFWKSKTLSKFFMITDNNLLSFANLLIIIVTTMSGLRQGKNLAHGPFYQRTLTTWGKLLLGFNCRTIKNSTSCSEAKEHSNFCFNVKTKIKIYLENWELWLNCWTQFFWTHF